MKAYGAWLESLRGESAPAAESDDEAAAAAQALRSAGTMMNQDFPALSQAAARLGQGEAAWSPCCGSARCTGRPTRPDFGYRELLEDQLDLVEELIARCQVLIGDRDAAWHGTDIDPDFAPSFDFSSITTR